ncbi:MAG: NAD(P)-binding domain-containing protein [Gemmatimonadota bacterium]
MRSCIVIGAGPGGIVCTKELVEQGLDDVLCLEQAESLGGTFATTYDNLRLTSSAAFSMYSDFPIGDEETHYFWTKDEAVDYWTRYAEHYGVAERVRFGTRVESVRGVDGGWTVTTEDGETFQAKRLALAVGNNSVKRFPEWQSELSEIATSHSQDYQNAERFTGKRVLVVGGGESASDVALEIARVAERSWVSLRSSAGWVVGRFGGPYASDASTHRGLWGLPRRYGDSFSRRFMEVVGESGTPLNNAIVQLNEMVESERGMWGIYGTKTLALPEAIADHECQVVGEIVEVRDGERTLVDGHGTELDGVDEVVFCTGFKNRIDFMPAELQTCDPRALYKHIFHPDLGDSLAWIGWARPGFGSQFPIMELQARYFALVATGQRTLPNTAERMRESKVDEAAYIDQFGGTAKSIRSLVDYHRYMDGIAKLIGCRPPLLRYLLTRPRTWVKIVYGPTQATQFRLTGPGRKVELAHQILDDLPVSPYNYLVVEGLLGRVRQLLEAPLPRALTNRIPWWSIRETARRVGARV